jgi:hypothetical protein
VLISFVVEGIQVFNLKNQQQLSMWVGRGKMFEELVHKKGKVFAAGRYCLPLRFHSLIDGFLV